jgi:hypothetical protein
MYLRVPVLSKKPGRKKLLFVGIMKVTEEKQDPDLDPCSSGKDPNQNFTDPKQ